MDLVAVVGSRDMAIGEPDLEYRAGLALHGLMGGVGSKKRVPPDPAVTDDSGVPNGTELPQGVAAPCGWLGSEIRPSINGALDLLKKRPRPVVSLDVLLDAGDILGPEDQVGVLIRGHDAVLCQTLGAMGGGLSAREQIMEPG